MKFFTSMVASMLIVGAAIASMPAHAQSAAPADATARQPPSADDMTEGEVRKIDKDAKKITLKHGPIRNLDMPGMTMVFQVKDPAMLDAVQAGDKVRFSVERAGGAMTITRLEPMK